MTDVLSRELSCKHGKTVRRASLSRASSAQQPRPEAVLGAKSPIQSCLGRKGTRSESSWAPEDLSRGRFGRKETRPEAVLALKGPSRSRLGRQEAYPKAVLDDR